MATLRSQGNIQNIISREDEAIILEKALIAYQNNRFDQGLNFDIIINEHIPFDKSLYHEMYNNAGVKHYVGSNLCISFCFWYVYTNLKNKDIIKKYDPTVNLSTEREEPYMFTIGKDTIEKMNSIKVEIKTDNLDQMSKVINNLKSSIERYKKFSNPGFFRKLFSNKLEIQANITISIINFENSLDNGAEIRKKLQNQYDSFQESMNQLKNIFDEFSKNIDELNSYIENHEISAHERDRLIRRKNDLTSAQLLCANSAAQFELSMSNTSTLLDKFNTIEQILKPVITQNMQLTKEMNRVLKWVEKI